MALIKLNNQSYTTLDATKLSGDLPAISGASLTGISAGKIGQVVHTKNTTYRSVTSSSLVECISVTITPSATSSKILVLNSAHIQKRDNNTSVIEKMFRNVGGVDTATQVLSDISGDTGTSGFNDIGFSGTQWYDTPSTTSAITYTYNIASYGNNSQVRYNNYNANGSFSSQMTAMEILA